MSVPARGGSGLSLVIPAYNEERRLPPTLSSYLPALEGLGIPFEVIVVMSGEDRTWELVERYAARHVQGIRFPTRQGKGKAILEGFRRARYDLVAYADADGSVPAHEIVRLVKMALERPLVVLSSRRLDRSRVEVGEPFFKKLSSTVWHAMVKVMLDLPFQDDECGFKVYTWELARMAVREVMVTNWVFDVDLLYHIRRRGFPMREVAVDYRYDMASRMRLAKAVGPMFLTLWGIFLVNRTRLRPLLPLAFMRRLNRRFSAE